MADGLTATVDTSGLMRAFDQFPDDVLRVTKPIAKDTAERIASEQRKRVARRTGRTASMIRVEEARDGGGYVVLANDPSTREHVEIWLEYGTRYMTARPFFFAPVALEAGRHDRDVREAIQDLMDAKGLGA